MSEELIVEREAELDVGAAEAWELISTPEGWQAWLIDDGDAERVVRVDEVIVGSRVGFTWWDRDDPSSASYVQLDVVELDGGRSLIHTSERFVGSMTMRSSMSSAAVQWDVRMVALWLLAVSHLATA